MADKAVKLRIAGRVQGVGFRAWVADQAAGRGLGGFVRNRRDGSVEVLLAGEAATVDGLAADCHHGPAGARVDQVSIEPAQGITPQGFRMLPTV